MIYVILFLCMVCIFLPFLLKSKETFDNTNFTVDPSHIPISSHIPTVFLKDKTNTRFDNYLGDTVFNQGESASSYIVRSIPEGTLTPKEKNGIENQSLIDFFKNSYNKYSKGE